jgi:hypothetical protein
MKANVTTKATIVKNSLAAKRQKHGLSGALLPDDVDDDYVTYDGALSHCHKKKGSTESRTRDQG